MLTFAIILAFCSFTVEMTFASKIPIWRQIAYQYKLANLAMSLALSYTLASLFGAAGLIAMTAAIIATLLSIPGYAMLHVVYDSELAHQLGSNLFRYYYDKFTSLMRDLVILFYHIFRFITFPVRMFRSIYTFFKRFSTRRTVTL
jgi:hypothetical protein